LKGNPLRGFKPADYDVYRSSKVGFVFQDYSLLPQLDVAANIGISLELAGLDADPKRIEKALASVDLQHCTHAWGNELSGGQKQRVAIARALVKDPEVILADEPTGALDQENGTAVFQLLKRLSADRLVVIVSHDEEAAKTYADRIITLRDGKVVNDQELHPLPVISSKPVPTPRGDQGIIPLKRKWKVAWAAIKNKPLRLITTLILSVASLGCFGLASCTVTYNPRQTFIDEYQSLGTAGLQVIFQQEKKKETIPYSLDGVDALAKQTGLPFQPIFPLGDMMTAMSGASPVERWSFTNWSKSTALYSSSAAYSFGLADPSRMFAYGYRQQLLAGSFPSDGSAILASSALYETAKRTGYSWSTCADLSAASPTVITHSIPADQITSPEAFLAANPCYSVDVPSTQGFINLVFPISGIAQMTSSVEPFALLDSYPASTELSQEDPGYESFHPVEEAYDHWERCPSFHAFFGTEDFFTALLAPTGSSLQSDVAFCFEPIVFHDLSAERISHLYDVYMDLGILERSKNHKTSRYYVSEFTPTLATRNAEWDFSYGDYFLYTYRYIFLTLALVLGAFAALMLASFIGASIAYQKRQIGLYRALGSKASSLYMTYQLEAWIINGLALTGSIILTACLAYFLSAQISSQLSIRFPLFQFTFSAFSLLVAFALTISCIACLVPCLILVKKKPIEVMRDE
jgi:ABC-type lipoprotein export system ATPase subunit